MRLGIIRQFQLLMAFSEGTVTVMISSRWE